MTAAAGVATPRVAQIATLAIVLGLWWWPVPQGLTLPAWRLFAIFLATIVAVVAGAWPILTASLVALAAAVLTGTLAPAKAYAGFANGTILLIVAGVPDRARGRRVRARAGASATRSSAASADRRSASSTASSSSTA